MRWDRQGLTEAGFRGFASFDELRAGRLTDVPDEAGAYVVVREEETEPSFLAVSTGGRFKGRDPSVPIPALEMKWVAGCPILYIGKADRLRRRLKQFAAFGSGTPVGHWGGRFVWHLDRSGDLLVAWKRAGAGQTGRALESELLAQFVEDFGSLPFANLRS